MQSENPRSRWESCVVKSNWKCWRFFESGLRKKKKCRKRLPISSAGQVEFISARSWLNTKVVQCQSELKRGRREMRVWMGLGPGEGVFNGSQRWSLGRPGTQSGKRSHPHPNSVAGEREGTMSRYARAQRLGWSLSRDRRCRGRCGNTQSLHPTHCTSHRIQSSLMSWQLTINESLKRMTVPLRSLTRNSQWWGWRPCGGHWASRRNPLGQTFWSQ